MIDEAHVQGIARFVVGFGTEEDEVWRDYHFDFCGSIDYDAGGVPTRVRPVENSGYSLGCLQLDFGQTTAAAEPFIAAFEAWHHSNPGTKPLRSSHEFAVDALKKDGHALKASPDDALRRQDVEALSEFVLSKDGSDWVNAKIDNILIGSDQQRKSIYNDEFSLVGIAREAEERKAFKTYEAAGRTDMTDLIHAVTMKAYNQSPGRCTSKWLPFLDRDRTQAELVSWPGQFDGAFKDGVGNAIELMQMWTKLSTQRQGWTPPAWLLDLRGVMDAQGLANPRTTSETSGSYVAARQVFEASDWFPRFAQALQTGTDYVPGGLFDSNGAIKIVPRTGRVHQGVLVRNKVGYVWDTAGNAFRLADGAWTRIPIGTINARQTSFERVRSFIRERMPVS